eukprot:66931_1
MANELRRKQIQIPSHAIVLCGCFLVLLFCPYSVHCGPCESIYGGGWYLVRHAYNGWHLATDHLKGTDKYGAPNSPTSTATWSIGFDDALSDDSSITFMFSDGDCSQWLVVEHNQLKTDRDGDYKAHVVASHHGVHYDVMWHYNKHFQTPIISWNDTRHHASILYAEANTANYLERFNVDGGDKSVNVWIKSRRVVLATFNSTIPAHFSQSQWFDGNERLMWSLNTEAIASELLPDLSFRNDDAFPLQIQYVKMMQNTLHLQFDDINNKMYRLNQYTNDSVNIIRYDFKKEVSHRVDFCVNNSCGTPLPLQCDEDECSLCVDGDANALYVIHPGGYVVIDFNQMKMNQVRWANHERYHILDQVIIYTEYLYFIDEYIGILRHKLSRANDVNEVMVRYKNISSFDIDKSNHIMYFCANHTMYHLEINAVNTSLNIVGDLSFHLTENTSKIHSIHINKYGTDLFIPFTQHNGLFVLHYQLQPVFKYVGSRVLAQSLQLSALQTSTFQRIHPRAVKQHVSAATTRKRLLGATTTPSYSPTRIPTRNPIEQWLELTAWQTSSVTLPRKDQGMACGHFNGSIFLLGGFSYGTQLVEYDIVSGVMIDHGTSILPVDTYGGGQYWTQFGESVLMIDPSGDLLCAFDLKTKQFKYGWQNLDIPRMNIDYRACLASNDAHIFVVGGGGPVKYLQV